MGKRAEGFALIVALVVASVMFSLALATGLWLRGGSAEVSQIRTRAEAAAEVASVAAVMGRLLTSEPVVQTDLTSSTPPQAPPAGEDPLEDDEVPEFPPELEELLRNMVEQPEAPETPEPEAEPDPELGGRRRVEPGQLRAPVGALRIELEGGVHEVTLQDLTGLLNVNLAPEEQLVRYFRAKGWPANRAETVAQQIIDWRDPDSFERPRGAETDDYARHGVTIRNGPMKCLEELLYLPAMDRQLFNEVAPDLTVLGDGKVHASTAPLAVLRSVPGMTPSAAEALVELRAKQRLTRRLQDETLGIMAREAADGLRVRMGVHVRLTIRPVDPPGAAWVADGRLREDGGLDLYRRAIPPTYSGE